MWSAFPAVYNFGMSALGFLKVFQMIDMTDGVLAERIFTDTKTTYIQFIYRIVISTDFILFCDFLGDFLGEYFLICIFAEK